MKAQDYAQALYEAIAEVRPEDHDKVLDNFAKILAQNGDLPLYDEIAKEFEKIHTKAAGIKEVTVTTASGGESKDILKEVNRLVGEKTEIKQKIDEKLIGGIIVRVDDTLIDASLKTSLNELKKQLTKN